MALSRQPHPVLRWQKLLKGTLDVSLRPDEFDDADLVAEPLAGFLERSGLLVVIAASRPAALGEELFQTLALRLCEVAALAINVRGHGTEFFAS